MVWEVPLIAMFFVFLLACWPLQNAIHEGAHAAAHLCLGDEVRKVVLHPTNKEGEFSLAFWEDGFTWAYMTYRRSEREVRPLTEGLAAAAPQLVNTALLSALLPVLFFADVRPVEQCLITALCVTHYIDGAWNLGTFYRPTPRKGTDGWEWAEHWGLGRLTPRLLAASWHLGFGAALFIPWR